MIDSYLSINPTNANQTQLPTDTTVTQKHITQARAHNNTIPLITIPRELLTRTIDYCNSLQIFGALSQVCDTLNQIINAPADSKTQNTLTSLYLNHIHLFHRQIFTSGNFYKASQLAKKAVSLNSQHRISQLLQSICLTEAQEKLLLQSVNNDKPFRSYNIALKPGSNISPNLRKKIIDYIEDFLRVHGTFEVSLTVLSTLLLQLTTSNLLSPTQQTLFESTLKDLLKEAKNAIHYTEEPVLDTELSIFINTVSSPIQRQLPDDIQTLILTHLLPGKHQTRDRILLFYKLFQINFFSTHLFPGTEQSPIKELTFWYHEKNSLIIDQISALAITYTKLDNFKPIEDAISTSLNDINYMQIKRLELLGLLIYTFQTNPKILDILDNANPILLKYAKLDDGLDYSLLNRSRPHNILTQTIKHAKDITHIPVISYDELHTLISDLLKEENPSLDDLQLLSRLSNYNHLTTEETLSFEKQLTENKLNDYVSTCITNAKFNTNKHPYPNHLIEFLPTNVSIETTTTILDNLTIFQNYKYDVRDLDYFLDQYHFALNTATSPLINTNTKINLIDKLTNAIKAKKITIDTHLLSNLIHHTKTITNDNLHTKVIELINAYIDNKEAKTPHQLTLILDSLELNKTKNKQKEDSTLKINSPTEEKDIPQFIYDLFRLPKNQRDELIQSITTGVGLIKAYLLALGE